MFCFIFSSWNDYFVLWHAMQVLFCRLAPAQRAAYLRYIRSREVTDIIDTRSPAFRAITTLRKLCNHPRLAMEQSAIVTSTSKSISKDFESDDDDEIRKELNRDADISSLISASGKLIVLVEILRLWHANGHRCLIFCQGRRMLSIIQAVVKARNYSYLRMDGTTPMRQRQVLVDMFNSDAGPFAFLLTTRVGGIGVNLIGADRVVIVDPDWVR